MCNSDDSGGNGSSCDGSVNSRADSGNNGDYGDVIGSGGDVNSNSDDDVNDSSKDACGSVIEAMNNTLKSYFHPHDHDCIEKLRQKMK